VQNPKLLINWDNGSGNITDSNVTAVVGQMISLSCRLVGPGGVTLPPISSYQWSIPGTALSSFFVSPDALQTNGYPVPLTQMTTNTVRFCWVDPGAKQVTCKVKVLGQDHPAETTFNVKRPNATLTANIHTGVEVYNNQLRFQDSFIDGITFMPRDEDTVGDWQYIQVGHPVYRHQDGADGKWFRNEGRGLDGHYPNPNDRDSPATELPAGCSSVTATGSFTTYRRSEQPQGTFLCPFGK
jgi:hypothetical protein